MTRSTPKRWFRFSLRTLLAVMMLVAAYCGGWVSHRLFSQPDVTRPPKIKKQATTYFPPMWNTRDSFRFVVGSSFIGPVDGIKFDPVEFEAEMLGMPSGTRVEAMEVDPVAFEAAMLWIPRAAELTEQAAEE